jgi:hypothetical protein
MGRVSWSAQAKADLESINRTLRHRLRRAAKEILHPISPHNADPEDEGTDGEIMWHRADGHGKFTTRRDNGPQDYFLFYRCRHAPGSEDPDYEVLGVCSNRQEAGIWAQMTSEPPDAANVQSP